MRIIVSHAFYGCETGCCGHVVEVEDGDIGVAKRDNFHFDHPWDDDDPLEFAKRLVAETYGEEHVKDLDWEGCYIREDD